MDFWEKLSQEPSYCSFEGATLDMLNMEKDYMHVRICMEGDLYHKYEKDLKDEYVDPVDHEFFVDLVFLSPTILREASHFPPKIHFGDVYFISALKKDASGVYSLGLYTHGGETFSIRFTFRECVAKPFGEMDCSFYYNHPEIFDKPFSLKAFLKNN